MDSDIIRIIRAKVAGRRYRMTLHAQRERFAEKLEMEAIEEALLSGEVIEDYPEDKRGHSCLLLGFPQGKPLHVVAGGMEEESEDLVVITVYRPDPGEWGPDWRTRRRRGR